MAAEDDIKQASLGFDMVFSNDLDAAKTHLLSVFGGFPFPSHGSWLRGVPPSGARDGGAFRAGLMAEATRLLTLAEVKAGKVAKASKSSAQSRRFAPGLDSEVLQADAILLLGLTQALSESYTGYLQCMYSLNSAHSKFTKIYKIAFPNGVDDLSTPSSSPVLSRKPSLLDVSEPSSAPTTSSSFSLTSNRSRGGLFGRWGPSYQKSTSQSVTRLPVEPDGPAEELIVAGAAFGYGLFNLVLSLLPAKIRGVVGFLGYNSDRRVALRALAVAATKDDTHAVFAGLTLMSYHGAVLLLSGYQADESHILRQYKAIVEKLQEKYPSGSLWILNRAKILRMSYDFDSAIAVLQAGLAPERPHSFVQADALLVFELAWTLLAQRRYQDSADMFLKMTELNAWSHATYYCIAAGCYLGLGKAAKAKTLLDVVPLLLDKRKLSGRDLPTEVFIRKKFAFYKQKATRRGGMEADYVASIRINLAEELGIFWNVHDRITKATAEAHLREWLSLSPPVTIETPYAKDLPPSPPDGTHALDLDTADELALRSLLVGVVHRSLFHYHEARAFLQDATARQVEAKWIVALSFFELAVLRLKETDAAAQANCLQPDTSKVLWKAALKEGSQLLDRASDSSANTDLSSRLDSRISLMRDEIALKRKLVLGAE